MTSPRTATWNREDRDLLVELRTNMATIVKQMTSMDTTMKEINAGYSSRLLALESNAVSRIEFDLLEGRTEGLEKREAAQQAIIKAWVIIGGGAWSVALIVVSVFIANHFHL